MRLIKQTSLFYQEGSSDKVYEVDLCEAGEDEFVVNFRYGRRGTRLKDGTKTPFPESREKAEAIFDKLVLSKTKKGYQETGDAPPQAEPEAKAPDAPQDRLGTATQRRKLHQRLKTPSDDWSLPRVLWRAGELGLVEGLDDILALKGQGALQDYTVAWALGKLRSPDSVPSLVELRGHEHAGVRRMAGEALWQCLSDHGRSAFEDEIASRLAGELAALLEGDTPPVLDWLNENRALCEAPAETLYDLYALAERYPSARAAVHAFVQPLPLRAPWFRSIRHLFKAAEFRLDGEMFGMIARKFERSVSGCGQSWSGKVLVGSKWVPVSKALADPNSPHAYTRTTRDYFKRRVLRTLRRAGDLRDAQSFITLATGTLMAYNDETDLVEPTRDWQYYYNAETKRYDSVQRRYDRYAPYKPLNYLLFLHSQRFEYVSGRPRTWCRAPYEPNGTLPGQSTHDGREEAFPELWSAAPEAIAHLLEHSLCGAVHEFAVNVWRENPSFGEVASGRFLAALLCQRFPITQVLGLEIAKQRYDPKHPDFVLVVALLDADLAEARQVGCQWLRSGKSTFKQEPDLLSQAILVRHSEVHEVLRELLAVASELTQRAVVGKVVAGLLALDTENDLHAEDIAWQARETLVHSLSKALREVGDEVVGELLAHSVAEMSFLGGQILQHRTSPEDIPDGLWERLLLAEQERVRRIGMELFGKLTDESLLERSEVLTSLCLSEHSDIREEARPLVERLAKRSSAFAQEIVTRFYPIVLRKETYEGLHEDTYCLLEGPLGEHLHVIPADSCERMLDSRYLPGQALGLLILKKFVGIQSLPLAAIARLGGRDLLGTREHVWEFYQKHPERVKEEKSDALRLVDANWQDTREFAFEYFSTQFEEDDWTPDLLVSLCDSVRGDVADFGRRTITRFFHEKDGPEYLLKLSQHPTVEMQTFASAYLERFASGGLERLKALEVYLITVLSLVNRGRVAKARTLKFLAGEAEKSREAAEIVVRVLTRQSVTIAIHDKAACIRTLHRIGQRWPDLETPLQTHGIPIYQSS